MQATLLAVGIAIILALVAALVGPHFVDWTEYRSAFEAEASRLAGIPVRVSGAIDVRILPTPSVVLRRIEAGPRSNEARLKARELAIELALGPLMRGEWRAAELRIVGPELNLGLDASGRLDWPGVRTGFDPDQLSIEQLAVEDGRAVLTDAASGARLVLDKLWFNGDVRSIAGPFKGEGGFAADGERFGYRVSAGRVTDDGAMRLRLAIDPVDYPLAIETDGTLRRDGGAPRYEGNLTIGRPAGVATSTGRGVVNVPWRATGRIKASAANALLEQIEIQHGPDERAIKLTGTADVKFGKSPRLEGVLSAFQIDLDRALELPEPARRLPLVAIRTFAETMGGAFRLPIPARFGIGIDSVILAGASLQAVRADVKIDSGGWDLETVELRAPGATQARISGRLALLSHGVMFKGPASLESNDPKALIAWLEGRSDVRFRQVASLRASGEVSIGSEQIAVDRLRTEIDRKTVEGRLAYGFAADGRPPRLEAELKAAELDIDEVVAFGRTAFSGGGPELPGEVALALDLGQATIAGVQARKAQAKLRLDANGLALDRVSIGDLGGAKVDLNGRIDALWTAPRGSVTLDLDARSLDGVAALVSRLAPDSAEWVRRIAPRLAPTKTRVIVSVEGAAAASGRSTAKIAIDGTAGAARLRLAVEAAGDPAAIAAADLRVDGQITTDDGGVLVQLLGLDRAVEVDKRPGTLSVVARGRAGGDLRVDARLAAGGLAVAANGTVRLLGNEAPSAGLDVSVSTADAWPARAARSGQKLPVLLRTKLAAARGELTLGDLSGTVAGIPLRGQLAIVLGPPIRIEGRLDADSADVPALLAMALGTPGAAGGRGTTSGWATEPFTPGALDGLTGRVELKAARASLTPSLAARQVRGVLRLGDNELALEDLDGGVAGGRLVGQLTIRRVPEGVAARGRFALSDADATAMIPGETRLPVTGRLALQVEGEGAGLSPAALIGSLKGSGTITLDGGQIAGLDAKAFEAVTRAVDQGLAVDATKIRDVVGAALDSGSLRVARADGALTIVSGQARLSNMIARGQNADLTINANLDLSESLLDMRITLSGAAGSDGPAIGRPDVFVALKGPVGAPKRTIDVTALTAWLTLRAVERETRRIEAIEADRREPAAGASGPPAGPVRAPPKPQPSPGAPRAALPDPAPGRPPAPSTPDVPVGPPGDQAPPLAPPIEVRPAPGANGTPRQPPSPPRATGPNLRPGIPTRPPTGAPSASPGRSILDQLFGPER